MKCPHCGQADTRVIDSRPAEDGTLLRRRRLCDRCGTRFTTHERVLRVSLIVVKKDGRREEFSRDKISSGIIKACNKRQVSIDQIEQLVSDIENMLRQETGTEVTSDQVGQLVMERLYHLDQVAYVRFASVYQCFDDVRRFAQLLERMSRRNRRHPQSPTSTNGANRRQQSTAQVRTEPQ